MSRRTRRTRKGGFLGRVLREGSGLAKAVKTDHARQERRRDRWDRQDAKAAQKRTQEPERGPISRAYRYLFVSQSTGMLMKPSAADSARIEPPSWGGDGWGGDAGSTRGRPSRGGVPWSTIADGEDDPWMSDMQARHGVDRYGNPIEGHPRWQTEQGQADLAAALAQDAATDGWDDQTDTGTGAV